ncbi:hypothetical protein [Oscillibacter sp.]|uniref:hypothetical protein n=1 Tax=Oscillibacter sp. TaxID=1945593 RepID=UPI002897EDFC|nr:hypothetical protein [Oscillibacter sp.]
MADYKELYLKMFRASEEAINLLIAVQQTCEELYISQPEVELKIFPPSSETENAGIRYDVKPMPASLAKENEPS